MIVSTKELTKGISCVYRIKYPNGRSYIGSTIDLRRRMWEHNNLNKNIIYNDEAILEFGKVKRVEILFLSADKAELEEKESEYILKYDTVNPDKGYNILTFGSAYGRKGDNSHLSKVTETETKIIRSRKMSGESKKDVYEDYKDKIGMGGFEHIWLGNTRVDTSIDVIEYFKKYDKPELISQANKGSKNGRAVLNEPLVRDIKRVYRSGVPMTEIHSLYRDISYSQIRRVCKEQSWKHVN